MNCVELTVFTLCPGIEQGRSPAVCLLPPSPCPPICSPEAERERSVIHLQLTVGRPRKTSMAAVLGTYSRSTRNQRSEVSSSFRRLGRSSPDWASQAALSMTRSWVPPLARTSWSSCPAMREPVPSTRPLECASSQSPELSAGCAGRRRPRLAPSGQGQAAGRLGARSTMSERPSPT